MDRKRKRNSYDAGFKLKVVAYAEERNNVRAAEHFGVTEKMVRDWRKKKLQLESMPKTKRANRTGFSHYPDMEKDLKEYIEDKRQQGYAVSRLEIRLLAEKLVKNGSYGAINFKASAGWCTRFLERHNMSLRQKTKIAQKLPEDLTEKVQRFQKFVIKSRKTVDYPLERIANMDETPMCFDMPQNTTIDTKGAKTILIKTTGHEKTHFTVVLACCADGSKLKPMVIFKRKTMPKEKFPKGVVVHVHQKGWMDERGVLIWLEKVWSLRSGALTKKPALLVWDQFRAHLTELVKEALKRDHQTTPAVIPGGLTSMLQPLDVSLNKPFKVNMKKLWQEWMSGGNAKLTPKGNFHRPDLALVVGWVKEAWESIPPEMIKKSFLKTSISNALDGTEDDILWQDDEKDNTDTEVEEVGEEEDWADDVQQSKEIEQEWTAMFGGSEDEEEFEGFDAGE